MGDCAARQFDVDGGVHGPGMLVEGEVAVDDVDLVAVALGDGGEEAVVEAGAEGALEVVEVDDDDGSGGGAAARGRSASEISGAGVGGDVVLDELGDGLAVVGEQEVDGVRGLVVGGDGDGDGVEAGDVGGLHGTDGDGESGGSWALLRSRTRCDGRAAGRAEPPVSSLVCGALGVATEGSEDEARTRGARRLEISTIPLIIAEGEGLSS